MASIDIQDIAQSQKLLIWGYLASLLGVVPYFLIITVPFLLYTIWRLSSALKTDAGSQALLILLSLIPVVSLIPLLVLNGKATRILKSEGVRVGLLGARKQDLTYSNMAQSSKSGQNAAMGDQIEGTEGSWPQEPKTKRAAQSPASQRAHGNDGHSSSSGEASPLPGGERAQSGEPPGRGQYHVRSGPGNRFRVVDDEGDTVELLTDQEAAVQRASALNKQVSEQDRSSQRYLVEEDNTGRFRVVDRDDETIELLTDEETAKHRAAKLNQAPANTPQVPENSPPQGSSLNQGPSPFSKNEAEGVYKQVKDSAVQVVAGNTQGSGVSLAPGYIVTAGHLVENSRFVTVAGGGQQYRGQVVMSNGPKNIALVYVGKGANLGNYYNQQTGSFYTDDSPEPGVQVLGVGPPDKYVSGQVQRVEKKGDFNKVILSTTIRKEASGGPVVDQKGRLLGVLLANIKQTERYSVAVSAKDAVAILVAYAMAAE